MGLQSHAYPRFEATDALLSRTKWSITANVNNGNARNAIDNNVSTRWDTGQSQKLVRWLL